MAAEAKRGSRSVRKLDPFMGKPVTYVNVGAPGEHISHKKQVFISGEKMLLGPFPDVDVAEWWFSHRDGNPPAFPPSRVSARVIEPPAAKDDVFEGLTNPEKEFDKIDGKEEDSI